MLAIRYYILKFIYQELSPLKRCKRHRALPDWTGQAPIPAWVGRAGESRLPCARHVKTFAGGHQNQFGGALPAFAGSLPSVPRYWTNQRLTSTVDVIRLLVLRQPCPSSGNSTYFTATPRCFRL